MIAQRIALATLGAAVTLPSCGLIQKMEAGLLPLARISQPDSILKIKDLRDADKLVALTIDDSPSPETGKILDLLAEHNATATFFVHGDRIRTAADREHIRRMLREGHEVANHMPESYPSAKLPPSVFERQFRRNHEILVSLGAKPVRFRPSHGLGNKSMRVFMTEVAAKDLGYRPYFYLASNFCWDVDWYGIKPECYGRYTAASATPGRITVFHDNQDVPDLKGETIDQTDRTLRGLPVYLNSLHAQGFSARSLAEVEAISTHPR